LIGIGLVLSFSSQAVARCAPDALGTARTIVLDPKKHRSLSGKEASLGLRHKEVILTFDDGPIAGKTSRILKSLKKECVKATFFYVGTMARAYPRLVRKVVNQGHTLAHHTHSHNRLPNYSSEKISNLIDKGVSRLQKIAYSDASSTPRTPFFRYPYLARSKRTDKVLAKKGMIAFGANIDSLDWKRSSPKKLHERIMRRLRKQGRGIILMHDIQARTAKMLPDLLSSLKSEGYKVVHIVSKTNKRPATKQVEVASLDKPVGRLTSTALPPRNAKKVKNIPLKYRKKRFYRSNLTAGSANQGRRSKRRAKPVLLAGVRTRGTIAMGNWKLRRSQWILR
jgi:peptidoglycan/xylan/chitin deacetylase (PgdA/CDA1 family)